MTRGRVHAALEWARQFTVPLLIIVAIVIPSWVGARVDNALLEVSCNAARSNQQQLLALHQVAEELGLPGDFTVTPLPQECVR